MEFDKNKLITGLNKEKAEIGKEYYFFNNLDSFLKFYKYDTLDKYSTIYGVTSGRLDYIEDRNEDYLFGERIGSSIVQFFKYMYPFKKNCYRFLDYEEMCTLWMKNPNMIIQLHSPAINMIGTINGFYENKFCCGNGDIETTKFINVLNKSIEWISDDDALKGITDSDGNPFTTEFYTTKYDKEGCTKKANLDI